MADPIPQTLGHAARTGLTQLGGAGAAFGHRECRDPCCGGAGAGTVWKYMQVIEPSFIDQAQAVLEHGFVFGGKTGDQVGTEGDAGAQGARAGGCLDYVLAQMAALHAFENHVRASLHREM